MIVLLVYGSLLLLFYVYLFMFYVLLSRNE